MLCELMYIGPLNAVPPSGRRSRRPAAHPPPCCPAAAEAERTPVWLMRQAGRYMAAFREYSDRIGFRERSETASIAIELSLQPWRAFQVQADAPPELLLTPLLSSARAATGCCCCLVFYVTATLPVTVKVPEAPPPLPAPRPALAPDGRCDHVLRHPHPAARAGH